MFPWRLSKRKKSISWLKPSLRNAARPPNLPGIWNWRAARWKPKRTNPPKTTKNRRKPWRGPRRPWNRKTLRWKNSPGRWKNWKDVPPNRPAWPPSPLGPLLRTRKRRWTGAWKPRCAGSWRRKPWDKVPQKPSPKNAMPPQNSCTGRCWTSSRPTFRPWSIWEPFCFSATRRRKRSNFWKKPRNWTHHPPLHGSWWGWPNTAPGKISAPSPPWRKRSGWIRPTPLPCFTWATWKPAPETMKKRLSTLKTPWKSNRNHRTRISTWPGPIPGWAAQRRPARAMTQPSAAEACRIPTWNLPLPELPPCPAKSRLRTRIPHPPQKREKPGWPRQ